ncbi:MAG TPA: RNA 3'-terminal phosphate cyclase [Myxococcales bacterium]|jgi:RNA 3'-terminal phosphate cyclase (ATP)
MSSSVIRIDGSDGGGQLIRTALTLSLATGKPFVAERIRARSEPGGLTPALLACVRAAQAVSGAGVEGAQAGSPTLSFEPGPLRAGHYLFDAGPAGAVSRLVQVLAVPLGLAGSPSTLKLTGLTHRAGAPVMPFLSLLWLPVLRELGHDLEVELGAAGYGAEAGGEVTVTVRKAGTPSAVDRRSRGTLREARVLSTVSNLPFEVAGRQSERALQRLREAGIHAEADNLPVRAPRSKGSCCLVFGAFERGRAGFASLGAEEGDAEACAEEAVEAFVGFMRTRGAVDEHLADQLLVPLALAAAGLQGPGKPVSRLAAPRATEHVVATASLIARFLDVEVAVLAAPEGPEAEIRVAPSEEGLVAALRSRGREI